MKLLTAFGLAAILATAIGASACGGSSTSPTINPPSVTETFTGTLDTGGSNTHKFVLSKPGEIDIAVTSETVQVNGVATAVTTSLALDLGVWINSSCQASYTDLGVKTGYTGVQAGSQAGATYCIRVYDYSNLVTAGTPVTYTVTVAHP